MTFDREGETLRALAQPHPPAPSPSGKLRVANLFWGVDQLGAAAEAIGMEITHSREGGRARDGLDFGQIAPFDILFASFPADRKRQENALEYALRFLYVRRPLAFLMALAEEDSGDFTGKIESKTRRMGYRTQGLDSMVEGYLPRQDGRVTNFLVGTQNQTGERVGPVEADIQDTAVMLLDFLARVATNQGRESAP